MNKGFSRERRAAIRRVAQGATALFGLGGAIEAAAAAPANAQPARSSRNLPLPSRIIDVHTHSMLPMWEEMLRKHDPQGRAIFEGRIAPEWSPEIALEIMEQSSIDVMVLSNSSGTRGADASEAVPLARQMNEAMAAIVAKYPRKFGAFAVLPLENLQASVAEVAYALDHLHLDGVCLQTNANGVYFGDETFAPLFAELNRRRATVFVHPVGPTFYSQIAMPLQRSMLEYVFESTRAVASLVFSGMRQRFPDFTYIATHGGGTIPFLAYRLETAMRGVPNEYGVTMTPADVRRGLQSLYYDLAASTSDATMGALLKLVPPSNILFGFDYPMRPSTFINPARAELVNSGLFDERDVHAISRGNALRILPTLARRLGS